MLKHFSLELLQPVNTKDITEQLLAVASYIEQNGLQDAPTGLTFQIRLTDTRTYQQVLEDICSMNHHIGNNRLVKVTTWL